MAMAVAKVSFSYWHIAVDTKAKLHTLVTTSWVRAQERMPMGNFGWDDKVCNLCNVGIQQNAEVVNNRSLIINHGKLYKE